MIFLWNDDPPVPAAAHSTFVFNDDGSISPHQHCPGRNGGDPSAFALGLRGSTCVLVSRYDSSRLIFDFGAPALKEQGGTQGTSSSNSALGASFSTRGVPNGKDSVSTSLIPSWFEASLYS